MFNPYDELANKPRLRFVCPVCDEEYYLNPWIHPGYTCPKCSASLRVFTNGGIEAFEPPNYLYPDEPNYAGVECWGD